MKNKELKGLGVRLVCGAVLAGLLGGSAITRYPEDVSAEEVVRSRDDDTDTDDQEENIQLNKDTGSPNALESVPVIPGSGGDGIGQDAVLTAVPIDGTAGFADGANGSFGTPIPMTDPGEENGQKPGISGSATLTPSVGPESSETPTPTPTEDPDMEETPTPAPTEDPDAEETPTPTPTEDPDEEETPTPTPTEDPDEEETPTPTPTEEPDEEETPTPTPPPEEEPGEKEDTLPTPTPDPKPTPSPSPTPTPTPSPSPSPTPPVVIVEEETPTPTPTPEEEKHDVGPDTSQVTDWPLEGLSDLNAAATENTRMHEVFSRPIVVSDFRFWSIGKSYAFAKADLSIREEKKDDAKVVGTLRSLGLAFVIQDEDKKADDPSDDWLYVESGRVRGFVRKDAMYLGREADEVFRKYCEAAGRPVEGSAELEKLKENADFSVLYAEQTVPVSENSAFTHTRSTTETVVISKVYAISVTEVTNIREEMDDKAEITGTMKPGTLCFVIDECKDGWLFIESGNVRGFVHRSDINMNEEVQESFSEGKRDEKKMPTAKAEMSTRDNSSLYYCLQSVRSGVPTGKIRESILEYASSFLGHPYVWGGTDPENGADCSGFVQSIYAQYGYKLPRVAEQQAYAGEQIPVEEAEVGDLIFYRDETGYIYHVVMYAGEGRTVEAHSSDMGIIHGYVSQNACWAVRVINDAREFEIPEEYDGLPIGTSNCYTYTPHYGTWNWQYACRFVFEKWRRAGGVYYQNVAVLDNKYLIACTNLYGVVGDYITWYFDDGSSIETIMADTKSTGDPNYTPWGHIHSNVINVLEFEVDLGIHPGTTECIPEVGGKRVVSWVNHGSAF